MGLRGADGLFGDDPFERPGASRPSEPAGPRTYTVAELSRQIQGALDRLGRVAVEGEISRITRAASGHVYFDLKDLDAKLSCTIWKSALAAAARFPLEEGMQVVAHGKLDVYAPRGTYALIVQRLEQKGLGALLAELEKLKETLRAKGWFDRKRPLPSMPKLVGVVTSRDGAALQDFLRTRALRWPDFPCVLAHTSVQGKAAAKEIAEAIRRVDALGVDVICVVRGGGSLEDLWAFNELPVAEAVWNARAPVVSGVGHQTDVTLIDFVADHRAHTPTDAAQSVIPDRKALLEGLEASAANLEQVVEAELAEREAALERLGRSRALREPGLALELRLVRLEHHARTLGLAAGSALDRARTRLERAAAVLGRANPAAELERRAKQARALVRPRLSNAVERGFERRERALALAERGLESTSPYRVLARGYSITRVAGSTAPLSDASRLKAGACSRRSSRAAERARASSRSMRGLIPLRRRTRDARAPHPRRRRELERRRGEPRVRRLAARARAPPRGDRLRRQQLDGRFARARPGALSGAHVRRKPGEPRLRRGVKPGRAPRARTRRGRRLLREQRHDPGAGRARPPRARARARAAPRHRRPARALQDAERRRVVRGRDDDVAAEPLDLARASRAGWCGVARTPNGRLRRWMRAARASRGAWRGSGLFDARYFAYMEDVDLGLRAKRAGWDVVVLGEVCAWHTSAGATGGGYNPRRKYMMGVNSVWFLREHAGPLQWFSFLAFDVASLPFVWLVAVLRGEAGAVLAKGKGILDGFRGRRVTAASIADGASWLWRRA